MRGQGLFTGDGVGPWVPGEEQLRRSRLLAAMRRWGHETPQSLHAASLADPEWFWSAVVEDLDVAFSTPFTQVRDDSDGKPFPKWFTGGRLNVAELCSHRHAAGPLADKNAIVFEGDGGQCRTLTYRELDEEVRRFAANLVGLGVAPGDRVVLFLPVVPQAVVAFLACAAIGAVSVPAFTGYGPEALATRLRESGAKVLVTADATTRRGKHVGLKATADEALAQVPGVATSIVVAHLDADVSMTEGRDVYWHDLPEEPAEVETLAVESDHPVTLIYTSGTTGAPKGIVHSHAGFAVKAATDFAYGFDIHDDDVIAWIADMGWMLGPLMIMGGLQLGATIVLVEGLPHHPDPQRIWQIAEKHRVTFQGIAPTAARLLMNEGATPAHDISSIRTFASTGEAWDDPTWQWLFDVGGGTRPIVNYSGGTETGGGILVSYPFLPIAVAGFNGPLPGMDVGVVDAEGSPVTGAVGELVVNNTWPGMTHAFWGDRERYLEAYWNRFPDTWVHGDLASVGTDGTWRVHGRSDDTIKVSGRRVGPAEIETALLKDPRVLEAAVIGVPDEMRGQRVVAFTVIRDADVDTADVESTALHNVGKSFAPQLHFVATLPKTKNGKIMRRAIRARYLDEPAGDLSSLEPSTPLTDIPTQKEAGVR